MLKHHLHPDLRNADHPWTVRDSFGVPTRKVRMKRDPETTQDDSMPRGKRSNREMREPELGSYLNIAPLDLPYLPWRCATPQAASAFPTPPSSTASGPNYRGPRTPSETPVTSPGSPSEESLSPEPEKENPFAIQFLTAGWLPVTTSPAEARPLKESLLCLETQKFSESPLHA